MWKEVLKHFNIFFNKSILILVIIVDIPSLCFTSIHCCSCCRVEIVFNLILTLSHFLSNIVECSERVFNWCSGSHYWLLFLFKVRLFSFERLDKVCSWWLYCRRFGSFISMIKVACIISCGNSFSWGFSHMISIYWEFITCSLRLSKTKWYRFLIHWICWSYWEYLITFGILIIIS